MIASNYFGLTLRIFDDVSARRYLFYFDSDFKFFDDASEFSITSLHGYVPDAFCQSTIIPLVKCKSVDLPDVNNYRAIALSNSVTKILETLLFDFIETRDVAGNFQFGFRKNHSTSICTHVFKQTVDYYRRHGSHVFTCFIDFNKAFDNVDYWLLFCKLIDSNDSIYCFGATRLLAFCYSRQTVCVCAGRTYALPFLMLTNHCLFHVLEKNIHSYICLCDLEDILLIYPDISNKLTYYP